MRRIPLACLFAILVATSTGYVYAHHSFAATYQEDKTAQIQGKLFQFTFRNPHSFLQIDSKDDDGKLVRWTVEWSGAGQLGDQGITRDSLRPGDDLIITGNPGRNAEDHRLRMKSMQRTSDGLKWSGTVE
jgi:Family of unknown function (DUF6152)